MIYALSLIGCDLKEDCKICEIINVKNPDLLNEICSNNDDHVLLPKLNCANAMCNRCKYNTYYNTLRNGRTQLNMSNDKIINYKCIHDKQRITKKAKKQLIKSLVLPSKIGRISKYYF